MDYERNFNYIRNHFNFIINFSEVHFTHEEIIKSAFDKTYTFDFEEEIELFNALVKLGFHDQSWKDLFFNKAVASFDANRLSKLSFENKLNLIMSLYYLKDFPEKNQEYINQLITSVNEFQHSIIFINRFRNKNENPVLQSLRKNSKKTSSMFKLAVSLQSSIP